MFTQCILATMHANNHTHSYTHPTHPPTHLRGVLLSVAAQERGGHGDKVAGGKACHGAAARVIQPPRRVPAAGQPHKAVMCMDVWFWACQPLPVSAHHSIRQSGNYAQPGGCGELPHSLRELPTHTCTHKHTQAHTSIHT
jgi:hypothetical protein